MKRIVAAAALATSVGVSLCCSAPAAAELVEYRAEYGAKYKSRNVGTSVFALQRNAQTGAWTFSTQMQARGILRLASPRPVIDRAEFVLDGERIVPQRFEHEDGSRKGEDNHRIAFDWESAKAAVSGDGYEHEVDLHAGVLDRGSLQVALLQRLSSGGQPSSFAILDERAIDEYVYEFQGEHTIETGLGDIDVVRYRQQRSGSSRYTLIDFAPSLGFVPARIEQIRDGESQSSFTIESFDTN